MNWWKNTRLFPPGIDSANQNGQHPGQRPGDIPTWEQRFEYDEGTEVVAPDGLYYRCIADHIASEDFASDIANWVVFGGVGAADTNDQEIVLDGDNVTLRLRKGTIGGVPIPDSTVVLPFSTPAPTKSGFIVPGGFTGSPAKAAVIFATPFADALYTPSVTMLSPDNYSPTVESITPNGFVINLNSKSSPTMNVDWTAIKHGQY